MKLCLAHRRGGAFTVGKDSMNRVAKAGERSRIMRWKGPGPFFCAESSCSTQNSRPKRFDLIVDAHHPVMGVSKTCLAGVEARTFLVGAPRGRLPGAAAHCASDRPNTLCLMPEANPCLASSQPSICPCETSKIMPTTNQRCELSQNCKSLSKKCKIKPPFNFASFEAGDQWAPRLVRVVEKIITNHEL